MKKWIPVLLVSIGLSVGCTSSLVDSKDRATPNKTEDYTTSSVYGGEPVYSGAEKLKVLKNRGYTVGYSETHKNPAWAAYRCFKVDNPQTHPRPSRFSVDQRTEAKVSHDDYTNSGYSRGHMAPNYVIDVCYGKDAQLETFLMSNICPQKQSLNGGIWQSLEMLIAKQWKNEFGTLWVMCGPIYDEDVKKLNSGVELPDEFFMIIIDEQGASPKIRVLAFIFKHEATTGQRLTLQQCLTTIDDIEQKTGLDFLHELPDDTENIIEAEKAESLW